MPAVNSPSAPERAPVVIIAVGNDARGDDALGPALLRELASDIDPTRFELIEEYQLQIENSLDLVDRELVLFIDAGYQTPPPFRFYQIEPGAISQTFSHALTPETLLAVYSETQKEPPPPAFVLCVSAESFELGEAMSQAARGHLAGALDFARGLVEWASFGDWRRLAEQTSCGFCSM